VQPIRKPEHETVSLLYSSYDVAKISGFKYSEADVPKIFRFKISQKEPTMIVRPKLYLFVIWSKFCSWLSVELNSLSTIFYVSLYLCKNSVGNSCSVIVQFFFTYLQTIASAGKTLDHAISVMLTRVTRQNNINYLNCVPLKLGFWWSTVSFTPSGPLSDRLSNSLHTFAFLFVWFVQQVYIWAKTGCNREKDQRRNVLKLVM